MCYKVCEEVQWVVEQYGILLFAAGGNKELFLGYPDAALWDFTSRGYDREHCVSLLRVLGSFDSRKATESYIQTALDDLVTQGYLEIINHG